ncbi:MAG: pyruvate dehydrogenase (acetyl-transferring) E1 component subunit alpha [Deltaproteobacteria bacterium]|nr:pyruvate dehydrogenase (acetyl-transferring) E1 component subunit alpha [Deltaproteobacteria bacterium]MBW1951609.1 pyruvate dehydrogenase (acetyl-transferring) E1 component subunit alpha [Deltaproteobacteria bacterium]MBW1986626.1 pyruvate dehydrogenase (acetyl-transferring) E1 component subunit alpha [Deltaproteobacteria bacterium]MBW2134773.1 pyruvate dehydrogenase (acetyl-transferring) E1 component subunit alpha [Deltaproteobacteria bacterium]
MLFEDYDPLAGRRLSILSPEGEIDEELRPPELDDVALLELYDRLVALRQADQQALILQRAGRMGTYPPTLGQEAANIGSAAVLEPQDWLVPSFRETGAMLLKGVPLKLIYLYWMGCEWGSHFPLEVRVLPVCAPVSSQTLHGIGLSWAAKLKAENSVTLIYLGDGGTSKGDFHEAMNFAGTFKTPAIFFIQNNQYAISVPRTRQTAAPTLAQKAIAYGFPGMQIDGNDLLAVYLATGAAVTRARSGQGPSLIEAVTYRLGPHTTADDPTRYRSAEELEEQKRFDPLRRVRIYLENRGLVTAETEAARQAQHQQWAQEQAREAEAAISYNPDEIFDYHFAHLPPYLVEQKAYCQRIVAAKRESGHA